MEEKRNYYEQLHNAARNHDTKLWAIPGLFFLIQTTIFDALDFNHMLSLQNGIIFFANSIFEFILFYHILLQLKEVLQKMGYRSEKQIDKLVYKLYGLNKEEIKIVEGYIR